MTTEEDSVPSMESMEDKKHIVSNTDGTYPTGVDLKPPASDTIDVVEAAPERERHPMVGERHPTLCVPSNILLDSAQPHPVACVP
jgi:hypothetical protein